MAAHSGLGLAAGALMYLVCLTGTLVVFAEEFERWETAAVAERLEYEPVQLERAVADYLARTPSPEPTLYLVMPTPGMPRLHLATQAHEWLIDESGALAGELVPRWTDMLQQLHIQLHLPELPGLLLVGVLGVMLSSLIVSGVLAHPRLLRDVFRLRRGDHDDRLAQADLHNRLGVWGLPFHLMIGLTGAFLGLVSLFYAVLAAVFDDNDRAAVLARMYGADIEISAPAPPRLDTGRALADLAVRVPQAQPLYLAVHAAGTDRHYMEIAATLPRRLVYSEIYRYSAAGEFINHQALADGPFGRQLAYSMYRLHFGSFLGLPVKIVYGLLGAALTVICATGVNIWLVRRARRGVFDELWAAVVWGVPGALALAAGAALLGTSPIGVFLGAVLTFALGALLCRDDAQARRMLQMLLAVALVAVPALHLWRFGIDAGEAAMGVNAALLTGALLAALRARQRRPAAGVASAVGG